MHSELVEHYQFIEFHLEGIYACLCGQGFLAGLKQVERHNVGRIMQNIKQLEDEYGAVFSEEEWLELERVNKRRNFWCHECYVELVFDRKTGGPRNQADIKTMYQDMDDAVRIKEKLYRIKLDKMHGLR